MSVEAIKTRIAGDFAKDTRLNLVKILSAEGAPGVSDRQRYGIALASAYTAGDAALVAAITAEAGAKLSDADQQAARLASTLMAMNNVYYRFVHLVGGDYAQLPANLRMQGLANPGVDKADFELYSLAVSAINGCGMCMESHARVLEQHGVAQAGIQSAIRIAAVVKAVAQAASIADMGAYKLK